MSDYTLRQIRLPSILLQEKPTLRIVIELGGMYIPVFGERHLPYVGNDGSIVAFRSADKAIQFHRADARGMGERIDY